MSRSKSPKKGIKESRKKIGTWTVYDKSGALKQSKVFKQKT